MEDLQSVSQKKYYTSRYRNEGYFLGLDVMYRLQHDFSKLIQLISFWEWRLTANDCFPNIRAWYKADCSLLRKMNETFPASNKDFEKPGQLST